MVHDCGTIADAAMMLHRAMRSIEEGTATDVDMSDPLAVQVFYDSLYRYGTGILSRWSAPSMKLTLRRLRTKCSGIYKKTEELLPQLDDVRVAA